MVPLVTSISTRIMSIKHETSAFGGDSRYLSATTSRMNNADAQQIKRLSCFKGVGVGTRDIPFSTFLAGQIILILIQLGVSPSNLVHREPKEVFIAAGINNFHVYLGAKSSRFNQMVGFGNKNRSVPHAK